MAYKHMRVFKNFNRSKHQSCGIGLLAALFLVFLSYVTMSKVGSIRISAVTTKPPSIVVASSSETSGSSIGTDDAVKDTQGSGITDEVKIEKTPICDFSNNKSDICEVDGDVRIIGKNTRMVLVEPSKLYEDDIGQSWTIKPYARKWDAGSGAKVRPVTLKLVNEQEINTQCTVNHSVPALVFAIGGWTGNFFHDFVDVLVPLFETAYRFGGNVQLLVANNKPAWIEKYRLFFNKISRYELIDYDNDDRVHCFKSVTLGLRCVPEDFRIDPARDPYGTTMTDLTKFLRNAYLLDRDRPLQVAEQPGKKPRLLIITRTGTRKLLNVQEVVNMAKEVGYQVVVTEADSDIPKFARIVNSCDVMMGVHGSGLTNIVFLPTNAVVIQVVPWGKLDWIAGNYFREPSKLMKLNYIEYSINEDETTLKDKYPKDHPVFTDPMSLHPMSKGWDIFFKTFLVEQDVRLDVKRFRPVLEQALQILREQKQS